MTDVQGLKELNQQFDRLKSLKFENLPEDLLEIIFITSQQLVPVKTGNLKESGHVEKSGKGAAIVYDADYAVDVEFGTSKQRAHPFLRPAIEMSMQQVNKLAADEVEREIERTI